MCTATWRHTGSAGYELFFNRDELHRRAEAVPPKIHDDGPVRFLSPVDPDGGGTWLGINDRGITIALLNYYADTDSADTSALIGASSATKSRGLLVTHLLNARDDVELRGMLQREALTEYRPFTLLVLMPKRAPFAFVSFETLSEIASPTMPITSSSYKTRAVIENRLSVYRRQFGQISRLDPPTSVELFDYHRSHVPKRSAESVCMHRHDGETRSFTYIRVTEAEATMRYTPGSPCVTDQLPDFTLPLCQ